MPNILNRSSEGRSSSLNGFIGSEVDSSSSEGHAEGYVEDRGVVATEFPESLPRDLSVNTLCFIIDAVFLENSRT